MPRFLGIEYWCQVRPSILPNCYPSTADLLQKHGAAEYLHSPADMLRRRDTQTLVEETLDPLATSGFPPVLLQDPNVLSP